MGVTLTKRAVRFMFPKSESENGEGSGSSADALSLTALNTPRDSPAK